MEKVVGTFERIVYQNEDNGFTVLRLREKSENNLITVTGYFAGISVGLLLEVKGRFGVSKYGEQFEASEYKEYAPTSIEGIEKYLSSGLIKGVGAVYGKKIVDYFKEDTLEILEKYPERLLEIEGIGEKKYEQIVSSYQSQREIKDVMIFLQSHGVSSTYALKIYKNYKNDSIRIVSENPYALAEDVFGIGFHIADKIASTMGFERDSLKRAKAGLRYLLIQNSGKGHVFVDRKTLLAEGEALLGVSAYLLEDSLDHMIMDDEAIFESPDAIYLPSLFVCENGAVKRLESILMSEKFTVREREKVLGKVIEKNHFNYNDEQRLAILDALKEKVMILTGGPGTGKTTTTLGIIQALEEINQRILIAAPTGRAAKRLSEITGKASKTIHRLLEFSPLEGFNKNENNPLDCNVVIIDEFSMVDIVLFYHLLKAVSDSASLIFIGDVDQLPSVGPGNVLRDLIGSGLIKTVYLKEIFRQGKESKIITNAHLINKGIFPKVDNHEGDDFFYIKEVKRERIFALIKKLCQERLPKKYGVDPIEDVQVLVPVKKGLVSTKTLNELFQDTFNPVGKAIVSGEFTFRVNDKVMQLKNNYDKNVFNGDIGRIAEVDESDSSLLVQFENELIPYEYSELDELQLAYAITIHKSQGSEYPVVIMPLVSQHFMMLQKNLIYTGLTRAKKLFILIGNDKALAIALKKDTIDKRNTSLKKKLNLLLEKWRI